MVDGSMFGLNQMGISNAYIYFLYRFNLFGNNYPLRTKLHYSLSMLGWYNSVSGRTCVLFYVGRLISVFVQNRLTPV